jgi:hypothetical protein
MNNEESSKFLEDDMILKQETISRLIETDISDWKFLIFEKRELFFNKTIKEFDYSKFLAHQGKSNSINIRRSWTRKGLVKTVKYSDLICRIFGSSIKKSSVILSPEKILKRISSENRESEEHLQVSNI